MFNKQKRNLLKLGIAAPLLLNGVATIDALTRPEFSIIRHWISHQSLGERGWLGTCNLLLSGVLFCAYTVGLKWALCSGKGSKWGPILIGAYGIGLLLAALFPIDPSLGWPPGAPAVRSTSGLMHDIAGALVFGALTAVCFVLAGRFRGEREWKGWHAYSLLSGLGVFIAFSICSVLVSMDFAQTWPGAPSGLFERISMLIGNLWILLFSVRLLRTKSNNPIH
ncbi:DUF998 domain-containing protein [Geobacillus sp. Y412MC52]|uniref:DUF998 domain-containing protein n=1 Tax=Geobacillus sp. (strain Y412MC52) TaxID=550542 RepID=UPI00018C17E6|nr:DUF998 domain-containing protein [Geobacillus sp. Y412MC52]ADU93791.1 hypothetical protein GYMC52_1332 [Geobacillus sp. Y412MC52]